MLAVVTQGVVGFTRMPLFTELQPKRAAATAVLQLQSHLFLTKDHVYKDVNGLLLLRKQKTKNIQFWTIGLWTLRD